MANKNITDPNPDSTEQGVASSGLPRMVLKRSLSPDGKINALSIVIDVPMEGASIADLQAQALKWIAVQDSIGQAFLRRHGKEKETAAPKSAEQEPSENSMEVPAPSTEGKVNSDENSTQWIEAKLVGLGVKNHTSRGRRFYADFELQDGTLAKFWGDKADITNLLETVKLQFESLGFGKKLDIPCRVVTKPNGRFIDVEQIAPIS